jgi:hypothetical protein
MDPTHADVAYGENERHRADLYLADSGSHLRYICTFTGVGSGEVTSQGLANVC